MRGSFDLWWNKRKTNPILFSRQMLLVALVRHSSRGAKTAWRNKSTERKSENRSQLGEMRGDVLVTVGKWYDYQRGLIVTFKVLTAQSSTVIPQRRTVNWEKAGLHHPPPPIEKIIRIGTARNFWILWLSKSSRGERFHASRKILLLK